MKGFNGFFLERENGKRLALVTDFILNKKTYYLFDDGNYYYEENDIPVMIDKNTSEGKKVIEKLLGQLEEPLTDVIGLDGEREETGKRIIVEKFSK